MIKIKDLTFAYRNKPLFSQLNLTFDGEINCLLGPSGSGKSTLLRLIAGFEWPEAGSIYLGQKAFVAGQTKTPPWQRPLGFVFQDLALFPHLTIEENVAFGLEQRNSPKVKNQLEELLSLVDLLGTKERYPHQISGGQQQRVAIARALARKPEWLLLDEPFSQLDPRLHKSIASQTMAMVKQTGTRCLFVTHDLSDVSYLSDKVSVLVDGKVAHTSTPKELFTAPSCEAVARFLGTGQVIKEAAPLLYKEITQKDMPAKGHLWIPYHSLTPVADKEGSWRLKSVKPLPSCLQALFVKGDLCLEAHLKSYPTLLADSSYSLSVRSEDMVVFPVS